MNLLAIHGGPSGLPECYRFGQRVANAERRRPASLEMRADISLHNLRQVHRRLLADVVHQEAWALPESSPFKVRYPELDPSPAVFGPPRFRAMAWIAL